MAEKNWLQTIENLMRKATNEATPQEERDTIMDKVMYLMAKHGIEESMLNVQEQKPIVATHVNVTFTNPYIGDKRSLLNAVAKMFGCFSVQTNQTKVVVFGTQEDLEKTLMLYYSLLMQMITEKDKAMRTKPEWEHGKSFGASFMNSYVYTIAIRIRDIILRVKADIKNSPTGNGMELVLVEKDAVIAKAVSDMFPRLTHRRSTFGGRSSAGHNAGRSAGQRADLGGQRMGGSHRREIGG